MKRYITSDTPRLSSANHYTKYVTGRAIRKPVKNWKMVLKQHIAHRAVKTQEREKPLSAELRSWLESIVG